MVGHRREVAQALEAAGPFWSDPGGLLTWWHVAWLIMSQAAFRLVGS
jgi:hypothetical protein